MWPMVSFVAVPAAEPLPVPPPPVMVGFDEVFDEPPPEWRSVRPRPRPTAGGVAAGVGTLAVVGVLTWSFTAQKLGSPYESCLLLRCI